MAFSRAADSTRSTVAGGPLQDLERALPLLLQLTGVDLSAYKGDVLRRRLQIHSRETGFTTVPDYLDRLQRGGAEAAALAHSFIEQLSVRVSSFFRDPTVFHALDREVFPLLFLASGRQPVQAWCVGCSRGQEVYSLAWSLGRFADRHHMSRPSRVLGTDVDRQALRQARRGEYEERLLEGMPQAVRRETLEASGDGRWRITYPLREQTRFQYGDALCFETHPRIAGGYDLIFCRNVLIYLDQRVQEELLSALRENLRPGGFLVLGSSETLRGKSRRLWEAISPAQRIYRRLPSPNASDMDPA